uniref:hypothetical protein n=1 Tax=Acinetobacter gerneri TaxID=202952 RepID=UPI0028B170F4
LPHHISTPFMHWMFNGGHMGSVKKNCIALRKGKNIGKIYCNGTEQPSYEMNEYCAERFTMFLKQYLNNGKKFIDHLTIEADDLRMAVMANNQKFQYLRVA